MEIGRKMNLVKSLKYLNFDMYSKFFVFIYVKLITWLLNTRIIDKPLLLAEAKED
jgi:hypothetical protein